MLSAKPLDISELAEGAARFSEHLEAVKNRQPHEFEWYPYSTLQVFPILDSLLTGDRRDLFTLAGNSPVLDIGCGDGALSFFLESRGAKVIAFDHPLTNHNGMRGFRALLDSLQSSVELEICDLDAGLDLKHRTYGLGICLGLLYHLKNPFLFLETLSRHVRYCIVSTRIAQVTSSGTPIATDPVAYLVDPQETNNDPSNYWIFSEAGLRRLFDRTGWELCDYTAVGCSSGSDPSRKDRDQRAYCALRSRALEPWTDVDLAYGWHDLENGSWRWTDRVFAVRMRGPTSGTRLTFRFILPQSIVQALGRVQLHATVDGFDLTGTAYETPGEHVYTQTIPAAASTSGERFIRFELDKAWRSWETGDSRELGVQVAFWSYQTKRQQTLSPITLD